MKKRKIFVSLLLLAALLAALGGQAFAETSYHVRLYAGNSSVGALDGSHDADVAYQGTYSFDASWVSVADDRYYVKGIREAGSDNDKGAGIYTNGFPQVERDMDFVVAYGMKGSAVQYTVNYVSSTGETLAPSQTFYGNVGDKPVVSYQYIEDYVPQALALTKTLSEDAGENVFTFTYTSVEVSNTTVVAGAGGAAAANAAGAAAGGNAAAAGGNAAAAGGNAGAAAVPETIIDLDVPLAEPELGTDEPEPDASPEPSPEPGEKDAGLPGWITLLLLLAAAGVISIPIVLRVMRRRGKEAEAAQLEEAYNKQQEKEQKEKEDHEQKEKEQK